MEEDEHPVLTSSFTSTSVVLLSLDEFCLLTGALYLVLVVQLLPLPASRVRPVDFVNMLLLVDEKYLLEKDVRASVFHPGKLTRRSRSVKRGSERRLSQFGATLSQSRLGSRSL